MNLGRKKYIYAYLSDGNRQQYYSTCYISAKIYPSDDYRQFMADDLGSSGPRTSIKTHLFSLVPCWIVEFFSVFFNVAAIVSKELFGGQYQEICGIKAGAYGETLFFLY